MQGVTRAFIYNVYQYLALLHGSYFTGILRLFYAYFIGTCAPYFFSSAFCLLTTCTQILWEI